MASIFNTRALLNPSFMEPELIITTAQPSGFMEVLGGRAPRVKLNSTDKAIYINRVDIRTAVTSSQAAALALPSATITGEFVQTATYTVRTVAEYSDIDVQEAANYNVALPAAQRLGMRQGTFQYMRLAALYGINANNVEGLLNTPGSTSVNLPPDTFGNTTLPTYDNGQIATWFLGQIQAALQRMYFLGTDAPITILGPQRVIGQLQYQNVVQLTSYQRPGAGTATSAQEIAKVAEENGTPITWAYDDTLIGKGSGSTSENPIDAVLLVVPEARVPAMEGINTNEFAKLSPTMTAMTLQYADVPAPIEVTTPIPDGIDVRSTMRISAGWAPRGYAVTILNIPF